MRHVAKDPAGSRPFQLTRFFFFIEQWNISQTSFGGSISNTNPSSVPSSRPMLNTMTSIDAGDGAALVLVGYNPWSKLRNSMRIKDPRISIFYLPHPVSRSDGLLERGFQRGFDGSSVEFAVENLHDISSTELTITSTDVRIVYSDIFSDVHASLIDERVNTIE